MRSLLYIYDGPGGGYGGDSEKLAQTYPNYFQAYNCKNLKCSEILNLKNRVWMLHNPYFYSEFLQTLRYLDFVFARIPFCEFCCGKKLTNGFSYFKSYRQYFQGWFPTIFQVSFKKSDFPGLGFYASPKRKDMFLAFLSILKDKQIPDEIPISILGNKNLFLRLQPFHQNIKHFINAEDFWASCSHFFWFAPSNFQDPFPHTLFEAVMSNHKIIFKKDPKRNFFDGIDDILSCLDYIPNEKLDFSDLLCKSCESLNAIKWKAYIPQNSEMGFNFKLPSILKKETFYDWIAKNI